MTKRGYSSKPYFKYAQLSCEVRANPTKSLPLYNHKCSNHALRVKSNLEAKHTISAHRSLSKPLPVKIWTSIGKLPQFNTDLIMIDHDWPITILTTICKNCSKSLKGCRLELEFWPLNICRWTNLACALVIFRLFGLTACVACLLTSPIAPTMWNSGSNPGKA